MNEYYWKSGIIDKPSYPYPVYPCPPHLIITPHTSPTPGDPAAALSTRGFIST